MARVYGFAPRGAYLSVLYMEVLGVGRGVGRNGGKGGQGPCFRERRRARSRGGGRGRRARGCGDERTGAPRTRGASSSRSWHRTDDPDAMLTTILHSRDGKRRA